MYIIIKIETRPFLHSPFQHVFNTCIDDLSRHRLAIFNSLPLAQRFIREQIKEASFLLLLVFQKMDKNHLRQLLIQRNISQFYNLLPQMTLYSPYHATSKPIRYNRHNQSLLDEDKAFVEAQEASAAAKTTKRSALKVQTTLQLPLKNRLPADFKLNNVTIQALKNNQLMDPISKQKINLDQVKNIACVQADNGLYQIYDASTLLDFIKKTKKEGKMFSDMTTRLSMNNAFMVSRKQIKDFVAQPTLALRKRSKTPIA